MQETRTPGETAAFDQLLTREELGNVLKLSHRTMSRLLATGSLPSPILLGKSYRWRASDVHAFIRSRIGTPTIDSSTNEGDIYA